MIELARKNALAIAAGHSFIVFLAEGFYPVNVLNAVKMVPEVCRIYCASGGKSYVVQAGPEFKILGTGDLGDPNVVQVDTPGLNVLARLPL